jgi:hypothetical protein
MQTKLASMLLVVCLASSARYAHAQEEADKKPGQTTSRMLRVAEDAGRVQAIIPTPQETYWGKGTFELGNYRIEMKGSAKSLSLLPAELAKRVRKTAKAGTGAHIVFTLEPSETLRDLGKEAYVLKSAGGAIQVTGKSETALWHGMATLSQSVIRKGGKLLFPEMEIVDYPLMQDRGILVDVGGQGFMAGSARWNFSQWKDFVDWMVDHKFNILWIEFIGSGRLMGNLNMDAGEWIGFPLALKSYPQLVCRNRPIRRWDAAQGKIVQDTYTAPNVEREFVGELIDYAQARGIKSYLFIGYDYFANQLPVVLGIPGNDPTNRQANKVYDTILKEITERYRNASGVVMCTIENKNVPPEIIHDIIRRTNDGVKIVRSINPKMEVGLLPDYLEWQPNQLDDIRLLKRSVPADLFLAYSPHREPQQKAWQRVHGNVWRYMNYSQYAWDHIAYIFPAQIRDEIAGSYEVGYRKIITQGWYFDVFSVNYLALAEYSWNATSCPVTEFWDKAMEEQFGKAAKPMRAALEHTRFDIRFDIIARAIIEDKIDREFTYWDMYVLHRIKRLSDLTLKNLENDARQSLTAAQTALALAPPASREMVEVTVNSAERRLYLATSARHLLKARELQKAGNLTTARAEMDRCLEEGEKLYKAATRLGIEFPLAVHDDELVAKYRQIRKSME